MTFLLFLALQYLVGFDYSYVTLAYDLGFPDKGSVFVTDSKGKVEGPFLYDWRSSPAHKDNAKRVMRLFRSM